MLCFDPDQSVMKTTATGCCHSMQRLFQNSKIYIGNTKCYGSDKLLELKDGDSIDVVERGNLVTARRQGVFGEREHASYLMNY